VWSIENLEEGEKRMDDSKLQEVLRLHKLWLKSEEGGERADLSSADLMNAQISVAVGGPAGSARRLTYYIYSCDEVQCGCFRGTLAEFVAKIEKTHKDNPRWLTEYRAMVEYFKGMREAHIEDREGEEG
jgi:hypothetical protein